MYHECTRNYNGKMWCATTSNFDIDGEGGECEGKMKYLFTTYSGLKLQIHIVRCFFLIETPGFTALIALTCMVLNLSIH